MTSRTSPSPKLLATSKLKTVHLEVTSKCNLRCTYCAVSQPGYKGYDLDIDSLDPLLDDLHTLNVEMVCLNGHGETTFHAGWKDVFRKVVGKFPVIWLTTNLAIDYSDEEIKLLSRIDQIVVSLDTHDPLLLQDTRRRVDLGMIMRNISRIRHASLARREDELTPHFTFSCVVHDKNVLQLPAFAHFVVSLHASHVDFCNLTKYSDLPGKVNVYPVSSLTNTDDLVNARESLKTAETILADNGVTSAIQDGLLASIDEAIANSWRKDAPRPLTVDIVKQPHAATLSAQRNFRTPKKGETRDCLDPWEFSIIYATGKVAPCCWHEPLHTLGKDGSLLDILSSEKTIKLRKQLLSGRLNKFCKTCPARGLISTHGLRKKVIARNRNK